MHANYSSFQKVAAFRTRESMDETGKGKGGFGMTIWGVYECAEACELVGAYILSGLTNTYSNDSLTETLPSKTTGGAGCVPEHLWSRRREKLGNIIKPSSNVTCG